MVQVKSNEMVDITLVPSRSCSWVVQRICQSDWPRMDAAENTTTPLLGPVTSVLPIWDAHGAACCCLRPVYPLNRRIFKLTQIRTEEEERFPHVKATFMVTKIAENPNKTCS